MSRLTTFKEKDYDICATFERRKHACMGCVWHSKRGCTIPAIFYPLTKHDMYDIVEDVCQDLTF